jgi:hypothetical protein
MIVDVIVSVHGGRECLERDERLGLRVAVGPGDHHRRDDDVGGDDARGRHES